VYEATAAPRSSVHAVKRHAIRRKQRKSREKKLDSSGCASYFDAEILQWTLTALVLFHPAPARMRREKSLPLGFSTRCGHRSFEVVVAPLAFSSSLSPLFSFFTHTHTRTRTLSVPALLHSHRPAHPPASHSTHSPTLITKPHTTCLPRTPSTVRRAFPFIQRRLRMLADLLE
jgi:hypothetical protein